MLSISILVMLRFRWYFLYFLLFLLVLLYANDDWMSRLVLLFLCVNKRLLNSLQIQHFVDFFFLCLWILFY